MKQVTAIALILFLFCSFTAEKKITIWMIGDSTMAWKKPERRPESGWGVPMAELVKEHVTVRNCAASGRSTKSFINQKRWKNVYDSIQPGDYVVIQFGHNDQRTDSLVHTEAFGEYKQNLKRFIEETRSKGGIPILCTPIVRRNFDGDKLMETHGDYLTANYQLVKETRTAFVDMEKLSRKLITDLGTEKSRSLFTVRKSVLDSTHLNNNGAAEVAKLFISDAKKQKLKIAKCFK